MSRRARDTAAGLALGVLLAAVVLRPLLWRPGSLPLYSGPIAAFDLADRNLNLWILAWTARAAVEEPGRLFDGNIYFPARNTLAGSETMLAHLPLTAATWWLTRDATWVLKAEMVWGIAGTALLVFLLARFLGIAPWAAALAAAAVALEPGRIDVAGVASGVGAQPQYLGFQYAPAALLALGIWYAGRRTRGAIWLALALGAQGLACFYLGYFTFLTVPLYALVLLWRRDASADPARRRDSRPASPRRTDLAVLAASLAGGALLVLPAAIPYLVARRAGAVRPPDPELAWIGSLIGAGWRAGAAWVGPLALGLGALGLIVLVVRRERPARWVGAALCLALGALLLALGPELRLADGRRIALPFRWLGAVVPGFAMLRGPLRALSLATLGLALAGAAGADRLGARWGRALRCLVALLGVAGGVLWVARVPVPTERAPLGADLAPVYRWLREQPREGGVLEVPGAAAEEDLAGLVRESRYMIASTTHWQSLVNGYTAYPPAWGELAKSLARRLPERDALQTLVDLVPLRWVVVHGDALLPEQRAEWEASAAAAGLRETRRWGGDVVYAVALEPSRDWRAAVNAGPADVTLEGTPTRLLGAGCRRGRLEVAIPAELRLGLGVTAIPARVENQGDCRWPALAVHPAGLVVLSAQWLAVPGARGSAERRLPPPIRTRLPRDLEAGTSVDVGVLVLSPPGPGDYLLRLTLAQEGSSAPIDVAQGSVRVVGADR